MTEVEMNSVPEPCEPQLLLKVALLVAGPEDLGFLCVWYYLVMEANWIPARHDVKGDDAAQRVRHYRHLPVFLKVWIPRAEERVKTIQLQSQTPGDLHTQRETQHIHKDESTLQRSQIESIHCTVIHCKDIVLS